MKNILLASAAAPALLYALPAQAQNCTAAPDCATLGYTKTASNCTGKIFTRCPFDAGKYNCADTVTKASCADLGYVDKKEYCPSNFVSCPDDAAAVRCLLDAKPGDLKYSLRTANHDGWLLCNGTGYNPEEWPELYAAIGNTFGKTLPNYSGYFLKAAATTNQAIFKTLEQAGLPNITGNFYARGPEYSVSSSAGAFSLSAFSNYGSGHSSAGSSTQVSFNASKSNSIYGRSTTVTPANYRANIFIFAGRKMSNFSTCAQAGYLDTVPAGQTCTETGGLKKCYKDCKPATLWESCVNKYTEAINYNHSKSGFFCYDAHYDKCGKVIRYLAESEISDVGCRTFVGQLASACTFDEACMSREYGISPA